MIPRTIHYCWFGGGEKPEIVQECIASWYVHCPHFEFVEWNEDNFDIASIPFAKEAYENGAWAFVSDAAHVKIIAERGGVYLDTDVLLRRGIDGLLGYDAFYFFETSRNLNLGLGFGASKNHPTVMKCLEYYENALFDKEKIIPSPRIDTRSLVKVVPDFVRNGQTQRIDNVAFLSGREYSNYAAHIGTGLWFRDSCSHDAQEKEFKNTKIKSVLRDPKKFQFLERHFGEAVVDNYTVLAYDVTENGIQYYLRKTIEKIMKKR